jgi:hypothetical protein
MKLKVTVSKVSRIPDVFSNSYSTAVDMYLDLENCELKANGTFLEVLDTDTNTAYLTDFAWASVAAIKDIAPVNGQWVLT